MSDTVPAEGYEHKINVAKGTAVDQTLSPALSELHVASTLRTQQDEAALAARERALERLQHTALTNTTVRDLLLVLGI